MARNTVRNGHFYQGGTGAQSGRVRTFSGSDKLAVAACGGHGYCQPVRFQLAQGTLPVRQTAEIISISSFRPIIDVLSGTRACNALNLPNQMVTGGGQNGVEILMSRIIIAVLAVCITVMGLAAMLTKVSGPLQPSSFVAGSVSVAAKTRALDLTLPGTSARILPAPGAPDCQSGVAALAKVGHPF